MLNYIWLGLVLAGVLLGAFTGRLGDVATGAIDMTKLAVMDIALPLAGVMALWLGLMRLAEKSGLVLILARALRPLMRRLFPDVPSDHPAIGAIVMNMAANMLGLANAATPLGLRAMQHLERLNPRPGTATNAMCTFLALNTSSVQLIPATVVAILAAAGSTNPTAVIGPAFVATLCSTIAGVVAVKFLEKLPVYRLPPLTNEEELKRAPSTDNKVTEDAVLTDNPPPLKPWGMAILFVFLGVMAFAAVQLVINPAGDVSTNPVARVVSAISTLAIPFLLAFFPLYAALRRVPVYEEFVDGAKEGFQVAIRIIPFLCHPRRHRHVPRGRRNRLPRPRTRPVSERHRLPGRAPANGADSPTLRIWSDRALHRRRCKQRPRQPRRHDGRLHYGQHGNDVLRDRGLLRIRRRPPDPPRRPRRPDR